MGGGFLQRIEVNRAALVHNIGEFRRIIGPRRKFMAVVKANAYGHGLREVAGVALENGVDWLGVNSVEEGTALRDAGFASPILVLGYVPLGALEEAVARDLRLIVYNRQTVEPAGGRRTPAADEGHRSRQGGDRHPPPGRGGQGHLAVRPQHPQA